MNERYYVLAAYHVRPWFTPGVYYAGVYVDVASARAKKTSNTMSPSLYASIWSRMGC